MEIPFQLLAPDTLRRLIEEFVTRDGTDNGDADRSLEERVEAVQRQLQRGEAAIGFDPETESCSVQAVAKAARRPLPGAPRGDLPQGGRGAAPLGPGPRGGPSEGC